MVEEAVAFTVAEADRTGADTLMVVAATVEVITDLPQVRMEAAAIPMVGATPMAAQAHRMA